MAGALLSEYALISLPATTASALGTLSNMDHFKTVWFTIAGLASESVAVTISYDGVNFGTAKMRVIDASTGAVFASGDINANGTYILKDCSFKAIKFTKSGSTDSTTITGSCHNL